MKHILDRSFKMIGLLENDSEKGMNYYGDQLRKRSGDGFYTGSCTVEKKDGIEDVVKEGNFLTFKNKRGEQLLMTIMTIDEDSETKFITYEDIGLDLINGYIDELIAPINPQNLEYYLTETLKGTDWSIGQTETNEALILEFKDQQSILERLQAIIKAFNGIPRYTVEFDGFKIKGFSVNVLRPREDYKQIRFDTDINIGDIKRQIDMTDVASRLSVRGAGQSTAQEPTEEVVTPDGTVIEKPVQQPEPTWQPRIVDRRNRAMGGQSNQRPLSQITHIAIHYTAVPRSYNRTIESHENYWLTTHGWPVGGYHWYIDSQGVAYQNYDYNRITYGVGGNNAYTVHVSVEANSSADYSDAQLKTRDWVVRKFMADLNIPARNVWQHKEFPGNTGNSCAGYTKTQMDKIRADLAKSPTYTFVEPEQSDDLIERAISIAHTLIGTPYAWGGITRRGFDCSGLIYLAYREAGFTNITHRCTTYTMWNQQAPFYRINTADRQRGDLVMMDTSGTPPGHVGIYLGDNMMLHTGGPNGVPMKGPVSISNYRVMGYVRVSRP